MNADWNHVVEGRRIAEGIFSERWHFRWKRLLAKREIPHLKMEIKDPWGRESGLITCLIKKVSMMNLINFAQYLITQYPNTFGRLEKSEIMGTVPS